MKTVNLAVIVASKELSQKSDSPSNAAAFAKESAA